MRPGHTVDRDPVGAHTVGQRIKLYRIGEGRARVKKVRCWFLGRLFAGDGSDCGPYYWIKEVCVSPRANSGEGFLPHAGPNGEHIYRPDFWYRCGYRRMEELPPQWEEVNEKAIQKRRKVHEARNRDPAHLRLIAQLEKTVAANAEAMAAMSEMVGQIPEAIAQLADKRRSGGKSA